MDARSSRAATTSNRPGSGTGTASTSPRGRRGRSPRSSGRWPSPRATGGVSDTVFLWNTAPGSTPWPLDGSQPYVGLVRPEPGRRTALTLTFSPDSRSLAMGWDNGRVTLWELATRQQRAVLQVAERATVQAVAFSPDGKHLATACSDGQVTVWSWGEKRWSVRLPGSVNGVAWAPDGRHLATANANGTVYILRVPGQQ